MSILGCNEVQLRCETWSVSLDLCDHMWGSGVQGSVV